MIFVCGIHGAGKTHYCRRLSEETQKDFYSASELIKKRTSESFKTKKVENIEKNQKILAEEIQKIQKYNENFILDGHLCLLDSENRVRKISMEVLENCKIKCLVVIVDGIKEIQKRIFDRDGVIWAREFVEKFQNEEIAYAKEIALKLNIELYIKKGSLDSCGKLFDKDIILPIKQEYAEKILKNEKKYEFRKRLCMDNVNKLYIYVTSPVKKIVGEVEILEKIIMDRQALWDLTKEQAGINKEYYEEYFKKNVRACAYKLGQAIRYEKEIELKDIGVRCVPQAFQYIPVINEKV